MVTDKPGNGDYVRYEANIGNHLFDALEKGVGYIVGENGPDFIIRNGDRIVRTNKDRCVLVAKQYRLEV